MPDTPPKLVQGSDSTTAVRPATITGMVEEEWTADRLRTRFGEYLTVEQVAELAGIKASTFRSYVTRGENAPQPDQRFGARSWAYTPETVAAWLASRRRPADEEDQ
ncbi:MAG TPA: helix-turn-helix domain-containing protein [Streptosporangiaceae bacterium]